MHVIAADGHEIDDVEAAADRQCQQCHTRSWIALASEQNERLNQGEQQRNNEEIGPDEVPEIFGAPARKKP